MYRVTFNAKCTIVPCFLRVMHAWQLPRIHSRWPLLCRPACRSGSSSPAHSSSRRSDCSSRQPARRRERTTSPQSPAAQGRRWVGLQPRGGRPRLAHPAASFRCFPILAFPTCPRACAVLARIASWAEQKMIPRAAFNELLLMVHRKATSRRLRVSPRPSGAEQHKPLRIPERWRSASRLPPATCVSFAQRTPAPHLLLRIRRVLAARAWRTQHRSRHCNQRRQLHLQ